MDNYRETDIVSAEVREITPQMASEMLAHNDGNRTIGQKKVQFYARLMREGSWRLTHQGIAVSTTGNVIDGQHRLLAVKQSGRAVKFLVTTIKANDGLGEITAIGQPIDIGKARSLADITDEIPDHVRIVRTLIRDYVPQGGDRSQDPEVVASAINIMRPSLDQLTARCNSTRKGLSLATVRGIMALRHRDGIDVLDHYKDALNGRAERLSKSWVSWSSKIEGMATFKGMPKNDQFRRVVAAYTWMVTDPAKGEDQMVTVRNVDRYHEIISDAVQGALMPALTKRRAAG